MKLYGNYVCTDCVIARKLLEKYKIPYEWIDVSDIPDFEGEIPRLEIDDMPSTSVDNKQVIVGINNIAKFLKVWIW